MNVLEITEYLTQKDYKDVDQRGVAYKMTGIDKDDLDKYLLYIQSIGRRY